VDSREAADALRGALISVRRDQLTLGEDEYFLFDLAGLEVTTSSGQLVGRVKDVQRLPGQDLFVILHEDGTESLVPDVPEFVDKSKLDEGKIIIHPIEGLLADLP
jgi:16S rRNA processing protein RimM